MYYSLLNIKTLVSRRLILSLMIVLSQIVAMLSVYLSVGFINNSLKRKSAPTYDQKWFYFGFYSIYDEEGKLLPEDTVYPEGALVSPRWGDIKGDMYELLAFLGDEVEDIPINGFGMKDGSDSSKIGLSSDLKPGGGKIVQGPRFSCSDSSMRGAVGDVYHIEGNEYTVTEVGENKVHIAINIEDYPDNARINYFTIKLRDGADVDRISQIKDEMTELFGTPMATEEPEPVTLMNLQIDNMFIFTSAVILLIAVVNIGVYFRYVFKKRENQIAVMKICGASRRDIFLISIIEMLGSFIVSLTVSLVIFTALLPGLKLSYKGFSLFDNKSYLAVFALVYLAVAAVVSGVLSAVYSSGSPFDNYRRSQKGGV
ncbi:FtsX-like permease family protein [Ruminococcus sp. NK3A76]|uniref:FtsX-like permease family protein n=1 Tax=Ruminococcus sp. NK3A76 TaxID=877411 RepID=UPI000490E318|nr:FtsX-like permease family protein [Ruminococcus sp. NK3A76]